MDDRTKIFIGLGIVGIIVGTIVIFLVIILKGGAVKEPITLTWWGYEDTEDPGIQKLIENYTKKYSYVTIEYSKRGESPEEYEKIVNNAIASGEGPDMYQIRNDWLPMHHKKMYPAPDKKMSKKDFTENFLSVAVNDFVMDDKVYAIPFAVDTLAVFKNNTVARNNPGNTWDDFKENVKKNRKLKGDFVEQAAVAMGTSNNVEYAQDILYTIMLQNNTVMTSDDNQKAYFNLSAKDKYDNIIYPGTSALEFYTSFASPSKETYTWNAKMGNSFATFIDGKSAYMFGYASDVKRVEKETGGKLLFDVFRMPQILGKDIYYAKYWATGVSDSSAQKDEAWNFLKYVSEKDQMNAYVLKTNMPSARKDIISGQKSSTSTKIKVFARQAESAFSWHKGNWSKTDKLFGELITNVSQRGQKAQAAIDSAAKEMDSILREVL